MQTGIVSTAVQEMLHIPGWATALLQGLQGRGRTAAVSALTLAAPSPRVLLLELLCSIPEVN